MHNKLDLRFWFNIPFLTNFEIVFIEWKKNEISTRFIRLNFPPLSRKTGFNQNMGTSDIFKINKNCFLNFSILKL